MARSLGYALIIAVALGACVRSQPQVIVITSTPIAVNKSLPTASNTITPEDASQLLFPTPDPTRPSNGEIANLEYVVQPGDTLYGIGVKNNVSLETLLQINSIDDPNILTVGQIIKLPPLPPESVESLKIIPDSRLVRGPGSQRFKVSDFVNRQPGYVHVATDIIDDTIFSASEVIERISIEYSVDPRLLLALLEYQSAWLSDFDLSDTAKIYPIQGRISDDGVDRSGLYKQLAWAANQLNRGYYNWKYSEVNSLELMDGTRLRPNVGVNAGTVGVQHFFSLLYNFPDWLQAVNHQGLYVTYVNYFGNPFVDAVEPLVPVGLQQPTLTLPFSQSETWFFTGGPHGGWGSGSAWSAVDFAPPDDRPEGSPLCYTADYWVTAVASGVVTRSEYGIVLLDLDGDGDETTGWIILYLHIASDMRVQAGSNVNAGDRIGLPSCEGGFSNATHVHIARRFNGEWIPVNCNICSYPFPIFVMGGWALYGLTNQEYQGYMLRGSEKRSAEQGRIAPDNHISW